MNQHESSLDLAGLEDFGTAVAAIRLGPGNWSPSSSASTQADGLYCAVCGDRRRMHIERVHWAGRSKSDAGIISEDDTPGMFRLICVQCETEGIALLYKGPDGPDLAILSSRRGGLSTPNTPESVAYYLDQAHRAESVSASSAAAAMYRSALEMLLYQEGYADGMLDSKIKELLADSDPPGWREGIDSEYLAVLKKIGNGAMHPNDGDVGRQKALDRTLLVELRGVFEELLDVVYERPARTAARKAKLNSAVSALET